jgi:hypothetical protein
VSPSGSDAAGRRCPGPTTSLPHPVRPYLPLEAGPGRSQRVDWDVLVDVHRLSVLPQVVESRKPPRAVTLERSFARVFSDVTSQMFASREAEIAWRVIGAVESLRLFLLGLGAVRINALIIRPSVIARNPLAVGIVHVHVVRVL